VGSSAADARGIAQGARGVSSSAGFNSSADALPFVTVIVPTRPGQQDVPAVTAARAIDYPRERMEILVARGKQPAIQRNHAIRAARGEIIYFLDDDAIATPGALRRAITHFKSDPTVKMVGGPNLCPADAPFLEQVFAVVLGSWIAFGPSRARYDRVGDARVSGEKELILCNLLARRDALLEAGGFDEALYPNEENALMDELQQRGGKLIYDPDVVAHRRPRPTLKAFIKMLMTYGRGRAEQFRLHPTPGSVLNFVPPLFVLFLLLLPLLWKAGLLRLPVEGTQGMREVLMGTGLAWYPLVGYAGALVGQTVANVFRCGAARALFALPLLFATHLFYGIGFWRGLFNRIDQSKPASTDVQIESVAI
jgi:succinoglycan biosynthesis protein ExoA